jgi:site-specific recombinase XerD
MNCMYVFRRFRNFLRAKRVRSARCVSLELAYEFLERCCRGLTRTAVAGMRERTRSILRFLRFARILPHDLTENMIAPRVWSLSDVPGTFSEEELARMFAELRSGSRYDLRERAMMLLFICYGLRRGEVQLLKVSDIDFPAKRITVRERKNRIPLVLPLTAMVEEAVRAYLDLARPAGTRSARLFVSLRGSYGPTLTGEMVRQILDGFLERCGLKGSTGKFRHTLATRLINNGVRLEAVQAVLGHQSSESTRIYAKLHVEALREVAENFSLVL